MCKISTNPPPPPGSYLDLTVIIYFLLHLKSLHCLHFFTEYWVHKMTDYIEPVYSEIVHAKMSTFIIFHDTLIGIYIHK